MLLLVWCLLFIMFFDAIAGLVQCLLFIMFFDAIVGLVLTFHNVF